MDGDDYVPQMSQMMDYSSMGMPSGVHQPHMMQQQYPPPMSGGLTPMGTGYDQQMMMNVGPPPPQPAPPKATKGKKKKESAANMDPMQSMAAMSNNPMMRPSMQQMGAQYPQGSGQMNMYGPGPGGSMPPNPHYSANPYRNPQYPPQAGYSMQPPMGYPQRPGYPPAGGPGYGYPPRPYPPDNQQYPVVRPQYPQGQQMPPNPEQYWDQSQQFYQGQQGQPQPPQQQQQQQQQGPPQHMQQPPSSSSQHPTGHEWMQHQQRHLYDLQAEINSLQGRLQQLYQLQRTPETEQNILHTQNRMHFLQNEYRRTEMVISHQQQNANQQPGMNNHPMSTSGMSTSALPHPGSASGMGPSNGAPGAPIVNVHPGSNPNPVQVTQTGPQVQVNIKPETSGRTLISVYHQYDQQPDQEDCKDSVPQEPIPSNIYSTQNNRNSTDQHVNQNNHIATPTAASSYPINGSENGFNTTHENKSNEVSREMQSFAEFSNQNNLPKFEVTPATTTPVHVQEDIKPSISIDSSEAPATNETINNLIDDANVATPPMRMAEEYSEVSLPTKVEAIDPSDLVLPEENGPETVSTSLVEESSVVNEPSVMDVDMVPDEEEEQQPEPALESETVPSTVDETPESGSNIDNAVDSSVEIEQMNEEEKVETYEETATNEEENMCSTSIDHDVVDKVDVEEPLEDEEQPESVKEEEQEPSSSEPPESVDSNTFTEPSTPVAVEVKKPHKRPALPKTQRKKKRDDDSGDDDGDYITESKAKKKRAAKKLLEETARWTADDFDEMEEDSILTVDSQASVTGDQQLVEKFLQWKEADNENDEMFYVKWKGKAYIHCSWKSAKELEELDKRTLQRMKKFKLKLLPLSPDNEEELFNSDYTLVDRIVDIAEGEDGREYCLTKWKSMTYDGVTWEPLEDIEKENKEKVDQWRTRQIIDKSKLKEKPRPSAMEWKKMSSELIWKNENSLREYQFEGVDWLLYCYYTQQNCILADEMGLGKTVQTITFLSQIYDYGIHGPFLIVVPLSTIQNWIREFEAWTDMNAIVYHGNLQSREILQQYEIFFSKDHSNGSKTWKKNLIKIDALITTFETIVTDVSFLKKINWRVCVIDEAHRLKNRNCKLLTEGLHSFRMEHRVLLTGTPLQNSIDELFSLLNFLQPEKFSSPESFMQEFGQCKTEEQVQRLQEILKPMMLRRLKEDVEKSLQPKQETIIEVQLSDTQKKYYRAILERNFSHLCKGTSAPSLMNIMMELRKCCNHPFLIQGAEESIVNEMKLLHPEWDEETLNHKALVQSSGKVVLIEKLLPKLRNDGHKVLVFSQMVKVLDLLEEFLINMSYPYERIDGNIRGDIRQASIDRFSKKDSDRFVFLLCTRAGGLGINLTAADTVIIFDSDWNPQNDLQAQARCHRIGQTKTVKVYRLITSNTYEREMFDRASLKLGLDKAVLQSTTSLRENSSGLSKKDVEELLKKGAYGSVMDESNEGSKFSEEDIDTILQRRTTTITLETGQKGSLFSKASFNSTHNKGDDIDIDDPNFWTKWAEKAQVDVEKATATPDGTELIIQEPRKRTKRFEDNSLKGEESDGSEEGSKNGRKRALGSQQSGSRKRRRGDEEDGDYVNYRPDELAFNKSEYFKVEKVLACWGWGRWTEMKKAGELDVSEMDIMHMSRTLLLHCVREYRGDERIRKSVWSLIIPSGAKHHTKSGSYNEGWAVLPEYNPPNFALDATFQRHIHRHANKLLTKIDQLHHLQKEIIGSKSEEILSGAVWDTIDVTPPTLPDPLCDKWDSDCDKCLLIGVYRHGLEGVEAIKTDETLCFTSKAIENFPGAPEIAARFKRLIAISQRNILDPVYEKPRWTKKEEQEFIRVMKTYGMKDKKGDSTVIDWDLYRVQSAHLANKRDEEFQEYLYCVLAMCTKVQGGELSAMDTKRALSIDSLSYKKAHVLLSRLHLTRRIHAMVTTGVDTHTTMLKLCNSDAMPAGWTIQHDKELLNVADEFGIENIASHLLVRPLFQKISRTTERTLLRRLLEICETMETGKWNGLANVESIEDSDSDVASTSKNNLSSQARARGGRKRTSTADESKMRAMLQQNILSQMGDQAVTAMLLQSMMMPSMMGGSSSSSNSNNAAAVQLLNQLIALSAASSSGSSANSQAQQQVAMTALMALAASSAAGNAQESDAVNLTKKTSTSSKPSTSSNDNAVPSTSSAAFTSASVQAEAEAVATAMGVTVPELMLLSSMPQETRIPVRHNTTKEVITGDGAPKLKNIREWIIKNPNYKIYLGSVTSDSRGDSTTKSTSKPSSSKTSNPSTPKPVVASNPASKAPTPAPSTPSAIAPKSPLEVQDKKSTSATATVTVNSSSEELVAVYNTATGEMLPVSKWPCASALSSWLDSNKGFNVHSSAVNANVKTCAGPSNASRLGGEPTPSTSSSCTPSTSKAAAASGKTSEKPSTSGSSSSTEMTAKQMAQLQQEMQMQLLMQQAILQQSMLGGFGSYGMPSTSSSSSKNDDAVNPMLLASLMANPLALQMMMDPNALAAASLATLAASASSSTPSSSKKSKQPPTSQ